MTKRLLTRRDLLRIAGAAGAMTIAPPAGAGATTAPPPAAGLAQTVERAAVREPLQALTAAEADILDAVVARLIPTDASGPGATEAMAARYIDRALAGFLSSQREAYRVGLAALDQFARSSRGAAFTALSAADQDAVLIDLESGAASRAGAAFQGSSAQFFALVRAHTLQGTFGDPYLRRQRRLRRLGSDRLSGRADGRHRQRAADGRRRDAEPSVGVRRRHVQQGAVVHSTIGERSSGMATRLKGTDVVVIGLGATGGVAVLPLTQAGMDVVGLEAGTWLTRRDFAPDEIRNNIRDWPQAVQKCNREIPTHRPNASAPTTRAEQIT